MAVPNGYVRKAWSGTCPGEVVRPARVGGGGEMVANVGKFQRCKGNRRNSAACAVMSNFYHLWEDRCEIQEMRENARPWKKAGRRCCCFRNADGRRTEGVRRCYGAGSAGDEGGTEEEVRLRVFKFVGKLKGCRDLETGRKMHAQIVECGFQCPMDVTNTLLDMYVKCGSMVDARNVFDNMLMCSVVSWNIMILGYAKKEDAAGLALELYARMQQEGVVPNARTFVGALKACSSLAMADEGAGTEVKAGCLVKGRAIHSRVSKSGLESNVFVGTMLLDMYVKCGSLVDAHRVFDELPHRTVVSWNVMILGYAEAGDSEEAFKLYGLMQENGLCANSMTFIGILKACGNTAALESGREIHAELCRAGLVAADMMVANALVDMYGKCGSMVDARQVFDALPMRNFVTWNALIAGYARQGECEVVFSLLERMRVQGMEPNGVTLLSVLTLCSHAGLVDKGLCYFDALSTVFGITPTLEHYTCMVGILGRAGEVDKAVAMVKKMAFQPDVVMWTSVLGVCRKWSNVEVGRHAFEHAVRLDKDNASAYVLMSNIYADAHMWDERDEVEAMRANAGAWKKPGKSWWTETGGIVHTFVVGDMDHPQIKDIHAKLTDVRMKMKGEGYVPDLDCVLRDMCDDEKEDALCGHSEKLAIACALINTPLGMPIRIVKNLRVCDDCHKVTALISKIEGRQIICRDATRFHVFNGGKCSCGDYW